MALYKYIIFLLILLFVLFLYSFPFFYFCFTFFTFSFILSRCSLLKDFLLPFLLNYRRFFILFPFSLSAFLSFFVIFFSFLLICDIMGYILYALRESDLGSSSESVE